jgi:hypothetical protein
MKTMHSRPGILWSLFTVAGLLAAGCGGGTDSSRTRTGGIPSYTASKGGTPAATTLVNTAGTPAAGAGTTATAGTTAAGGTSALGGATATAGTTGIAGTTAGGGSPLVGGSTAPGGTTAVGGTTASTTGSSLPDAGAPEVSTNRIDAAIDATAPDAPDAAVDTPLPTDLALGDTGSTGACGTPNWNRSFPVNLITGAAIDENKNLIFETKLFDTLDFGLGPLASVDMADIALVKLDPTGKTVWAKSYGDLQDQLPGKIALAKSGVIGMFGTYAGSFTIKNTVINTGSEFLDYLAALDADGAPRWIKSFDTKTGGFAAIASHPSQSTFAVCGYTTGAATDLVPGATAADDGLEDILLAKVDASTGAILWSRQIGGVGMQTCTSLAMDAAGDVFAAGHYNRTLDLGNGPLPLVPVQSARAIWAGKFDGTTGAAKVGNGWDSGLKNVLKALALDGAGNLAIVGAFRGSMTVGTFSMSTVVTKTGSDAGIPINNTTDAFVIKLDGNLNPQWLRSWGDASGRSQELRTVAFVSGDDLLIAGKMTGTLVLGDGQSPLVSATGADFYENPKEDAFWLKLRGPSGTVLCAGRHGDEYPQAANFLVTNPMATDRTATMIGDFQSSIDFGLGPSQTPTRGGSMPVTYSFVVQFSP